MALASLGHRTAKWYHRHVADKVKNLRRQVRRAVRHPGLALAYRRFQRAVARRDWADARRRLIPLATAAERAGDTRLLMEMAFAAQRLGEDEKSNEWAALNARLTGAVAPTDWRGENLADATLIVRLREHEKQGKAEGLAMAGYVAEVAPTARHCVLIAEQRLAPLFARTLPGVEVLAYPAEAGAKPGTRLVTASALTLQTVLGVAQEKILSRFLPLKADAALVAGLRAQYRGGRHLPVIGVSWWSSHFGKDLPGIEFWSDLVRSTDAVFVSLQYGDVAADVEMLRRAAPERWVVDASVDQLADMDRFAAQLGALDAVVTISNTGAHLAGAMGVPTLLLRDDLFRRQWPVLADRTPWHPRTRIIGKDGREWQQVFMELDERLKRLLAGETD